MIRNTFRTPNKPIRAWFLISIPWRSSRITFPIGRFVLPARTRLSSAPSRQGKCLDDTKLGACGAYGKGMRLGVEMQSVACFCAWIFKVQRSWISEASRSATGASDLKFHRVFEYWNLEVLFVVRSNFSAEKYACSPKCRTRKPAAGNGSTLKIGMGENELVLKIEKERTEKGWFCCGHN
jgi:hypothetical protein